MIILIYKEKILLDKEVPSLYDPLTKGNGVAFVVSQDYSEFFLLSFFPSSKKKVTAYSMSTNDPIPLELWTPEMQKEADIAKSEAKGTWKLFMFWYVFIILILGAFIYTRTQAHFKNKDKDKQLEYFANPQVGDIVYANTHKDEISYVSPFKIVDIKSDTLFVTYSDEKDEDRTKFLIDPSKTVGEFDTSDAKFISDTLVYNLERYQSKNFESFMKFKSSGQKDEKNYPRNIIYIQRPD